MDIYCSQDSLEKEPVNSKETNAYRKIQGIRKTWPQVFWALGPSGKGYVYQIHKSSGTQCFHMESVNEEYLKYKC